MIGGVEGIKVCLFVCLFVFCFRFFFCRDKRVYTFAIVISPKVNMIARLEFEFAYYDLTVQSVSQYFTGIHLQ